ncbi:S-layer homology domain-containing protein [Anoxybacterium hadale]|uniref:S-layer homology domain-containing protein n=1 Tax=Anoxybacterium hadale TaxID=3408580 RepID=A0ACD1AF43_9FIRM|nr:S-layer homology domain-containing protein [Clostridiales bacterium]
MKKIMTLIVSASMIMGSAAAVYGADYSDLKNTNWAYEAVNAMSNQNIVKGYPDGSFHPSDTVTYGEFIKMALTADTGSDIGNAESGYWAESYYNKALEEKYFLVTDIGKSMLSMEIPRSDMALIISAILGEATIENYEELQKNIKDISYKTKHEYDITKAYATGILTGYTDKTFRPDNTLTRAEAATVIYRLVDESKRVLPVIGGAEAEENRPLAEVITNYKSFYTENGYLDEDLAAVESYSIDKDPDKYGMTLKENRGTKWIEFPANINKDVGLVYLVKDNIVIDLTGRGYGSGKVGTAGYDSDIDITTVDYIASLKTSRHHITLIKNPFKQ